MENASKALIIAGGVLIAIMIITLGVYMFQSAGALSQSYDEKLSQDAINAFNNKFLTYGKDINAQNMVSLLNLIKENNEKNSAVSEKQVKLLINNVEVDMSVATEQWKINIMQLEATDEEPSYKFIAAKYNDVGYVKQLEYKALKAGYIYVPVVCNHNWNINTNLGDKGHTVKCTKCSYEVEVAHSYESYQNQGDGTHTRTCECGYNVKANHIWQLASTTEEKHKSICTLCSATQEERHEWSDYQSLGDTLGHSRKCNICAKTQTLSHTWGEWQTIKEANCTQDGEKKSICTICSESKTEAIVGGTSHNFSIAATCTTPKKCSRCGETSGTPLGHYKGPAATCTSPQKCTRCSTVLASALGHNAGTGATCTSPQRCTRCNTVLANALGHNAGAGATCTSPQRCTRCNTVLANALGHNAGAAATCTTVQRCTRCSTVLVNALGHNAGAAATCTNPQTCTRCNIVLANALGHSAGAAATCTTVQKCTRCSTILANALGHSPGAAATCTKPQMCIRCSTVLRNATGHSSSCYSNVCKGTFVTTHTTREAWCPVCGTGGTLWRTRYHYKCYTCGRVAYYEPDVGIQFCSKCHYRRSWGALGTANPTHAPVPTYLICTK